jgi:hypothetical protein
MGDSIVKPSLRVTAFGGGQVAGEKPRERSGFLALENRHEPDRDHSGTMKIDEFRESPASGPLRGTAGQGDFSIFRHINNRGGDLFWGGGVHCNCKRGTFIH